VPVHSILLLLRRQAQHSSQTGTIAYASRPGLGKMDFDYEVLRLWERPVEALLAGGLGLLPLAPLCRLPAELSVEEGVRWAVNEVCDRLAREATPAVLQRLLTATFVLSGLRLDRQQARAIFQGVRVMRESDTYQAILDEGREEGEVRGIQRALLNLGRDLLGEPDEATRSSLKALTDLDRLDRLSVRLPKVSSWQELLQTP
jgi:predicted transposase YdaD